MHLLIQDEKEMQKNGDNAMGPRDSLGTSSLYTCTNQQYQDPSTVRSDINTSQECVVVDLMKLEPEHIRLNQDSSLCSYEASAIRGFKKNLPLNHNKT
jgi:hypothetical protein